MIVNYVLIALFLINFKRHVKELMVRSLIRAYYLSRSFGGPKVRQAKHHNYRNGNTCEPNDDNDDDVAQHGGHPANTKSCSLELQHIFLILAIHIILN